jgi:hypothetical protein
MDLSSKLAAWVGHLTGWNRDGGAIFSDSEDADQFSKRPESLQNPDPFLLKP